MTKEEIRYLVKRYPYIAEAIRSGKNAAFFSISGRKERIAIDDDIKKFSNTVLTALEKTNSDFEKKILSLSVLEGKSDVYVFSHATITRGTFYSIKLAFIDRLYCLCILAGLVSQDEI